MKPDILIIRMLVTNWQECGFECRYGQNIVLLLTLHYWGPVQTVPCTVSDPTSGVHMTVQGH